MKLIVYLFAAVLIFSSCSKEENQCNNCIQLSSNPNFDTVNFKSNYTIQIPHSYIGYGMVGFEGNEFRKQAFDSSVLLFYSFCWGSFCTDFGHELPSPEPAILDTIMQYSNFTLDQKTIFYNGEERLGIFYYNQNTNSRGLLYWRDNGRFKAALDVTYQLDKFSNVVEIIRTIKKR